VVNEFGSLMQVPGALAAFQYSDKGDLTQHVIKEGTAINSASTGFAGTHLCANSAIATMRREGGRR